MRQDLHHDPGYYGIRIALALHLSKVPEKVLEKGILQPSHPALVVLIAAIAARFGVVVTQKAAAQMVPILGALSGALVNIIFIQHFQDVARAHFTMRRLERKYGPDLVRRASVELEQIERVAACLWQRFGEVPAATQTVFGEGPTDSEIMFVGEQPGNQEDLSGHPFVGPAGKLLDRGRAAAGPGAPGRTGREPSAPAPSSARSVR